MIKTHPYRFPFYLPVALNSLNLCYFDWLLMFSYRISLPVISCVIIFPQMHMGIRIDVELNWRKGMMFPSASNLTAILCLSETFVPYVSFLLFNMFTYDFHSICQMNLRKYRFCVLEKSTIILKQIVQTFFSDLLNNDNCGQEAPRAIRYVQC